MRIGLLPNALSCLAMWSGDLGHPIAATAPAFLRVSSVVCESPGQLAAVAS